MSLEQWHKNGWLKPHRTTQQQIADLLAIAERDLRDAKQEVLSEDWQYGIAYNAALKLCTVLLYAKGYRPEKNLAHYRTIAAMPMILGNSHQSDADYLDTCRAKRNTAEYDAAGQISSCEAEELIDYAIELKQTTLQWLTENHPELITE